jgi:hypothetical protein
MSRLLSARACAKISFVAEIEKREIISFEAGRARKRAVRMLAAKLDYEDVTTLLNALLDKQIEKYFPDEMKSIEAEDPKASSRRQARKKAG